MAISKQRLEELIKQGATIYHLIAKNYEEISTNDIPQYKLYNWELYKEYYFETKEEAEWYLEFGNITRTETLRLPRWEEFELLGHNVDFIGKDNTPYHFRFNYNKSEIYIVNAINGKEIYCARPTKENYLEACRLAKKLFLGEEV